VILAYQLMQHFAKTKVYDAIIAYACFYDAITLKKLSLLINL